jgi:hypothetical protein
MGLDQHTARPTPLPRPMQYTIDDTDPFALCIKFNPAVSHK